MKNLTPAEFRELDQKRIYVSDLIDEFKQFVLISMNDGHHENFNDHLDFLDSCMEVFIDQKEED